ncbi:MAG: hypothetical protein HY042_01640 [Spirochaetia bacterium]|nr:hypothetical protein [Spirochaetia bacterium]
MEVKMKAELGIRTAEGTAHVRQMQQQEKNVPGVASSDRQEVNLQKEASAIKPSQATDHFKVQGGSIDVVA